MIKLWLELFKYGLVVGLIAACVYFWGVTALIIGIMLIGAVAYILWVASGMHNLDSTSD
jgi:uncharacterized membrane protein YccC